MVQKKCFLFRSIIKSNRETSAQCYKQLFKFLVCMTASAFTTRHIINPICPSYLKRNLLIFLNDREISPSVFYLRNIYYLCFRNFHLSVIL